MRIGYSVEGATDRALLEGLKARWCPEAELVPGTFRGSTQTSMRREIPRICAELSAKYCQVIVFQTNANDLPFRRVKKSQIARVPPDFSGFTIMGVAERNIECWLCADPDWLSKQKGIPADNFRVDDPKDIFEAVLKVSPGDRKEKEIANIVIDALLKQWLARSQSFAAFYADVRAMSKTAGCQIPDER